MKETEKGNIKPMTYTQIAEALGISPESVRAIEFKALRKLRNQGKLDKFRDMCDGTWRDEGKGLGRNTK